MTDREAEILRYLQEHASDAWAVLWHDGRLWLAEPWGEAWVLVSDPEMWTRWPVYDGDQIALVSVVRLPGGGWEVRWPRGDWLPSCHETIDEAKRAADALLSQAGWVLP